MTITLYKTKSESNKINKTLTSSMSFTGTLKDECSILSPTIFIESENLSDYNYLYIKEFNRYYFINDIKNVRNNIWSITGEVDVLYTYKDKILSLPLILEKSENDIHSNKMLNDGSYITTTETFEEILNFQSVADSNRYYLLTCI